MAKGIHIADDCPAVVLAVFGAGVVRPPKFLAVNAIDEPVRLTVPGGGAFGPWATSTTKIAFRTAVTNAAREAMGNREPMEGPLVVTLEFKLLKRENWPEHARPGNRWPSYPWLNPSLNTLINTTIRAPRGEVWLHESQIIWMFIHKEWSDTEEVEIYVKPEGWNQDD